MFTITIKLENLAKKEEKYLEREFAYLEKTTKKPREQLFMDAFINYIAEMEWRIKEPEITKEVEREIRKSRKNKLKKDPNKNAHELEVELHKEREEKVWKKYYEIFEREPRNYHIKWVLFNYLEDMGRY